MLRFFFVIWKTLLLVVGAVSTFPVKKARLGLYNPVKLAEVKYNTLMCAIFKLIGAVTGKRVLSTADHIRKVKEEQQDGEKIRILQRMQNSRELIATKSPLRNAFSSEPSTRVPGRA